MLYVSWYLELLLTLLLLSSSVCFHRAKHREMPEEGLTWVRIRKFIRHYQRSSITCEKLDSLEKLNTAPQGLERTPKDKENSGGQSRGQLDPQHTQHPWGISWAHLLRRASRALCLPCREDSGLWSQPVMDFPSHFLTQRLSTPTAGSPEVHAFHGHRAFFLMQNPWPALTGPSPALRAVTE